MNLHLQSMPLTGQQQISVGRLTGANLMRRVEFPCAGENTIDAKDGPISRLNGLSRANLLHRAGIRVRVRARQKGGSPKSRNSVVGAEAVEAEQ